MDYNDGRSLLGSSKSGYRYGQLSLVYTFDAPSCCDRDGEMSEQRGAQMNIPQAIGVQR